jgi:hypothetical protein
VHAYLAYSQNSHMANGRFWLIPLGIGGAALTIAAALRAATLNLPPAGSLPIYLAGARAVAHTFSTVKAGGINWTLAPWRPAERRVATNLDRFARWQALRASLQFLTFAVAVWALAANTPSSQASQ